MNKNAQSLGKLGGRARAKKLSKKRRSEIGKMGAAQHWKNWKKKHLHDDFSI